MTRAICIRCGADKLGAFTACFACRFDPTAPFDKEAMAKSLLLSDNRQDDRHLDDAGAVLASGRALTWPQDEVAALAAKIDAEYTGPRGAAPAKPVRSCGLTLAVAFAAVAALAGIAACTAR